LSSAPWRAENRVKALSDLATIRVRSNLLEIPDHVWENGLRLRRRASEPGYDPTTAQFLSVDPLVAQTRSPYGYVGGNPLNNMDATGLCSDKVDPSTLSCAELYDLILQTASMQQSRLSTQLRYYYEGQPWGQYSQKYYGHLVQFYLNRDLLSELVQEYDNRPCDGPGLPNRVYELTSIDDPYVRNGGSVSDLASGNASAVGPASPSTGAEALAFTGALTLGGFAALILAPEVAIPATIIALGAAAAVEQQKAA
jgi:hypothetical protein